MDLLDRVPMDFSSDHRGGQCGRIITDPEEAKLAELDDAVTVKVCASSRALSYRSACSTTFGRRKPTAASLAPSTCPMPWFHQDLTRDETENMFKHCKHKEGCVCVCVCVC